MLEQEIAEVKNSPNIEISSEWQEICRNFLDKKAVKEDCLEEYQKRHLASPKKISLDHFYGKLGEVGTSLLLGTPPPDFKEYVSEEKRFGADLLLTQAPIHVKCCEIENARNVGAISWVFQVSPTKDTCFADLKGFIALTFLEKSTVYLAALVPTFPTLYWMGSLKNDCNNKQALYWSTLKAEFGPKLRRYPEGVGRAV